jgi:protein-tyrosine phosphatase
VLVHCAAGKDRTGVVVAMALEAVGCERDAVVADYLASAERINAIIERLVASPTYRGELEGLDPADRAPRAETMPRFLEIVDQRLNGSAQWLAENGLDAADLDRLRERLGPVTPS